MQSFSWKVLYEAVIFKANLLTLVSNSFHYRLVVFIYFFQSLHCLWDVLCYYFPALSLCIVGSDEWLFLFPLSSVFENHILDFILHIESEARNI